MLYLYSNSKIITENCKFSIEIILELMTRWSQYGFQDGVNYCMQECIIFHDFILLLLVFIIRLVGVVIIMLFYNCFTDLTLIEGQIIEYVWTFIPGIVLIFIAIPSIKILYTTRSVLDHFLRVKVIGNQWYWRYEYIRNQLENSVTKIYDSYIISDKFLENYEFRLLEVDNNLKVPYGYPINLLLTSKDVLHSWTVPRVGLKVDAVPGRINRLRFFRYHRGFFFGQCSEICGAQHRFIPIVMEVINYKDWREFIKNFFEE